MKNQLMAADFEGAQGIVMSLIDELQILQSRAAANGEPRAAVIANLIANEWQVWSWLVAQHAEK